MNSVRNSQLAIPPNRGPRKIGVEKTPVVDPVLVVNGFCMEIQAVTKDMSIVPVFQSARLLHICVG
jgi:hypothetical protein